MTAPSNESSGNPPDSVAKSGPWLTKAQAAEYLRVSPRSVQRLIAARALDAHRVGKSLRLRREDLDDLMARSRVDASTEPERRPGGGDFYRSTRDGDIDTTDSDLIALGREAHRAGIQRIFKSRVEDAAYKAAIAAAFGNVDRDGSITIMSNSLRFLLLVGPQADLTLALPLRDALRRGVELRLLLLDPHSNAARIRAGVELGTTFTEHDATYFQSHLYRDIIAVAEALTLSEPQWSGDEDLRRRLRDRQQVQVRFSQAEPSTHLTMTQDLLFVEHYHSGGDLSIQAELTKQGIPDLHCFGGFSPVLLYERRSLAAKLIASHFERSWSAAADGPTPEGVVERARSTSSTRSH